METYAEPPIGLTHDEMIQKLRDAGNDIPDNMPVSHLEDLFRNRFHGPDLPFYYEGVAGDLTVAKWKIPITEPEPPADEVEETA